MSSNFTFHYNFGKILTCMNTIDTCLQNGDTQKAIKGMIMIQMVPMSEKLFVSTGIEKFLQRIASDCEGRQGLFATRILEQFRSGKYVEDFHVCKSDCYSNEDNDENEGEDDSNEENTMPPRAIRETILEDILSNITQYMNQIKASIHARNLHSLRLWLLKLEEIPMCIDLIKRSGIKDFIANIVIDSIGDLATISFRIWRHCHAVILNADNTIEGSIINKNRYLKLTLFYSNRINANIINKDNTRVLSNIMKLIKIPLTIELIIISQIKLCLYRAITVNDSEVSKAAYILLKNINTIERVFLFGDKLNNSDEPTNKCDNKSTNIDKQYDPFSRLIIAYFSNGNLLSLIIDGDNPNENENTKSEKQDAFGAELKIKIHKN